MRKILIGLALVAAAGVSHARSAVPLIEPDRVALVFGATNLTPDLVKQAIARGGQKHGWTVSDEQPGRLRLKYIKQGKHEVVVDVTYDTTGFLVRYVDSTNMKYGSKDGVPVIHPFYNQWVANLSRAISGEASALATSN
jgi:hypothetical protein